MEGRQRPPPASHLFPDDPTPINKKFWGTPSMRGFFAFGGTIFGGWMCLMVFNGYLMRNEDRIAFTKVDLDGDKVKKKLLLNQAEGRYWSKMVPGFLPARLQIFPDKNHPEGHDLRFDDSVKMDIPRIERVNNLRIR